MPIFAPERRRAALAAGIGNVIEWYDWSAYATFAVFFSHQFFPKGDPTAALLQTFAVFAVGFIARPIGSVTLGRVTDRMGRRPAMLLTVLLMAATSAIIGLSPTADSIGVWAGVILVTMRLIQGLALGAETGAVTSFLSESAGTQGRGSLTSVYAATAVIGTLVGTLVGLLLAMVFTPEQLGDWGWRVPFLLGGVLGLAALAIRRGVDETADLDEEPAPSPVRTLWREHRADVLRITMVAAVLGIVFFTFVGGFTSIAVLLGADSRTAFAATSLGLALSVPFTIWTGHLSDRYGRRPLLLVGYALTVVVAPIVVALMWTPDAAWRVFGAQLVICIPASILQGVTSAAAVERIPPALRGRGYSFVWAVAMAVFGGTGPMVATWLGARGLVFTMSAYVIALCVLAGLGVLTMREVAFAQRPWEEAAVPRSRESIS